MASSRWKPADGAAGAVRLAVFMGDDEGRAVGALHDARGENADDTAMPSVAVEHKAAGGGEASSLSASSSAVNLLQDGGFHGAAVCC